MTDRQLLALMEAILSAGAIAGTLTGIALGTVVVAATPGVSGRVGDDIVAKATEALRPVFDTAAATAKSILNSHGIYVDGESP